MGRLLSWVPKFKKPQSSKVGSKSCWSQSQVHQHVINYIKLCFLDRHRVQVFCIKPQRRHFGNISQDWVTQPTVQAEALKELQSLVPEPPPEDWGMAIIYGMVVGCLIQASDRLKKCCAPYLSGMWWQLKLAGHSPLLWNEWEPPNGVPKVDHSYGAYFYTLWFIVGAHKI